MPSQPSGEPERRQRRRLWWRWRREQWRRWQRTRRRRRWRRRQRRGDRRATAESAAMASVEPAARPVWERDSVDTLWSPRVWINEAAPRREAPKVDSVLQRIRRESCSLSRKYFELCWLSLGRSSAWELPPRPPGSRRLLQQTSPSPPRRRAPPPRSLICRKCHGHRRRHRDHRRRRHAASRGCRRRLPVGGRRRLGRPSRRAGRGTRCGI